jgi:hypothetical protein
MKNRICFLIIWFMVSTAAASGQQIPNNSFEDWTIVGSYEMPDFWDNLNPSTDSTGIYTCTKGTPGSAGTYFINLTSTWVPGLNMVIPGIAVSGIMDQVTQMPVSGFAFSERPEKLTGKWQYMSFGGDNGFVQALLTRWNATEGKRDTVAYANYKLSGMVHTWQSFTIPFDYFSGSYPDSCIIVLNASGLFPADFDFLWVDDLAFAGSVVTWIPRSDEHGRDLAVFPNPSGPAFSVQFYCDRQEQVRLIISDERGVQLQNSVHNVVQGSNVLSTFIQGVKPGSYLVTIRSSSFSETKKIIIR